MDNPFKLPRYLTDDEVIMLKIEFEKYAQFADLDITKQCSVGSYENHDTHMAWVGWKARYIIHEMKP